MRFAWDAALETGHDEIDSQHRSLFGLANDLDDALGGDDYDVDTVENAIYGLTDYVVEHFADEEALMADEGYPGLSAHRSLHEYLTRETMGMAARYFNGERVAASKIAPFVTSWLKEHILGEDMRFIAFMKRAQ